MALAARQRSPQWHEARRQGVGSSDAPIIAGVAPWGDIRALYAEKLGIGPQSEENEPMRWGRLLENAVAEGYTEITGNKLRRVNLIQRHPRYPFMLASVDRAIVGRKRLLEIKTSRFRSDEWGTPGTDQIPDHYAVQVQHQMAVTGYREADVAVLFSGSDLKLYTVPWDQTLVEGLIELEQAFWKCVTTQTPPPELQAERLELRTDAIPADERITAMVAQLREDRARYAEAKAIRDGTENALKAALDDATFVRGDGFQVIYRRTKDKTKVGWEQIARAYRHLIEESGLDMTLAQFQAAAPGGLDAIESLYTHTEPGSRPLLIKWENPNA